MEINNSPSSFFDQEFKKANAAETVAREQVNTLALVRVITFFLLIGSIWAWNKTIQSYLGIVFLVLLVIFFILMKRQQKAKRIRNFQKNLQTINEDEIERLSFRFKRSETGVQYQEKNHNYASDLDIFGEFSLFRLLNRTRTSEGEKRLSHWLKNHADLDDILMRQEAAEELKSQPEWSQTWQATALLHEHAAQQVGAFQVWASETLPEDLTKALKWRYWAIVTVALGILYFAGFVPGWAFLLSLAWHGILIKRFNQTIQSTASRTTDLGHTLVAYSELLQQAEKSTFRSRWWKERQELIKNSSKSLKDIGVSFERLDYRNNVYFALFLGVPTLWDLYCLAAMEKWKALHRKELNQWLDVLADIEAMNSLAGHAYANPEHIKPQVSWERDVFIDTIQVGHPLIKAENRVSNDFQMKGTGQTILITGSNMSGKSTFLRTIGLNLVLAQMGAVVSAVKFFCSPVRVYSSMRTQDSLEENTSSFYAELKRLRQLLEMANDNHATPIFYLLDEILKGTNSADRHRGAQALITQLHPKNASGFVSTHDLELGEWGAHESYVHNFHFRSDMENGQLHFDYKLHPGICRSFNASELMKMMGIEIKD